MRVAVFGGSFNPPHLGHVLAGTWLLATGEVDHVLVVPAHRHAFGKPLAPFALRMQLARAAFACVASTTVDPIEFELSGESRTVHTIEALARLHPTWALRLVIGTDVLAESDKWYRFERIRALAPPLVLPRGSVDVPSPLPVVSSTQVRRLLREGGPAAVRDLVPRAVHDLLDAAAVSALLGDG
jgi:nicotinate-nucleotide adenylyltransferase